MHKQKIYTNYTKEQENFLSTMVMEKERFSHSDIRAVRQGFQKMFGFWVSLSSLTGKMRLIAKKQGRAFHIGNCKPKYDQISKDRLKLEIGRNPEFPKSRVLWLCKVLDPSRSPESVVNKLLEIDLSVSVPDEYEYLREAVVAVNRRKGLFEQTKTPVIAQTELPLIDPILTPLQFDPDILQQVLETVRQQLTLFGKIKSFPPTETPEYLLLKADFDALTIKHNKIREVLL